MEELVISRAFTLEKFSRATMKNADHVQSSRAPKASEWHHYSEPALRLLLDLRKSINDELKSVRLRVVWTMARHGSLTTDASSQPMMTLEDVDLLTIRKHVFNFPTQGPPLKAVYRDNSVGIRYLPPQALSSAPHVHSLFSPTRDTIDLNQIESTLQEFQRFQMNFSDSMAAGAFIDAIQDVCPCKPNQQPMISTASQGSAGPIVGSQLMMPSFSQCTFQMPRDNPAVNRCDISFAPSQNFGCAIHPPASSQPYLSGPGPAPEYQTSQGVRIQHIDNVQQIHSQNHMYSPASASGTATIYSKQALTRQQTSNSADSLGVQLAQNCSPTANTRSLADNPTSIQTFQAMPHQRDGAPINNSPSPQASSTTSIILPQTDAHTNSRSLSVSTVSAPASCLPVASTAVLPLSSYTAAAAVTSAAAPVSSSTDPLSGPAAPIASSNNDNLSSLTNAGNPIQGLLQESRDLYDLPQGELEELISCILREDGFLDLLQKIDKMWKIKGILMAST